VYYDTQQTFLGYVYLTAAVIFAFSWQDWLK